MNIIVSDDIPKSGSGASTEYAVYFFQQGAVATGQQYCDQVYYHSRDHEWSSTELINRVKNS